MVLQTVGKTTRDLYVNTKNLLGKPVNKHHTRKVGVLMPEKVSPVSLKTVKRKSVSNCFIQEVYSPL